MESVLSLGLGAEPARAQRGRARTCRPGVVRSPDRSSGDPTTRPRDRRRSAGSPVAGCRSPHPVTDGRPGSAAPPSGSVRGRPDLRVHSPTIALGHSAGAWCREWPESVRADGEEASAGTAVRLPLLLVSCLLGPLSRSRWAVPGEPRRRAPRVVPSVRTARGAIRAHAVLRGSRVPAEVTRSTHVIGPGRTGGACAGGAAGVVSRPARARRRRRATPPLSTGGLDRRRCGGIWARQSDGSLSDRSRRGRARRTS